MAIQVWMVNIEISDQYGTSEILGPYMTYKLAEDARNRHTKMRSNIYPKEVVGSEKYIACRLPDSIEHTE